MKKFIYADNAATTSLSKAVLEKMTPYLTTEYANPSSLYSFSHQAKQAVEEARAQVATALGANTNEIYFTSGGSEADNWAIKGTMEALSKKGKKHIISSAFEHHAVLHTLKALEKQGFEVTLLPVHEDGLVRVEELKDAIREDTGLVTIMFANNEIGTIQPIKEIAAICKEKGVLCHTDAVQAVGHIPVNVADLGVDMLSLSAHKFHGPKGIGALYIRRGIRPVNLIEGGAQERNRRAGTENVASIVGMGVAIEAAHRNLEANAAKALAMRERLLDAALQIPHSRLNGDRVQRLPGNANISFEGVEGEALLLMLDNEGIAASSGSACTSGSLDPSHVLLSIGLIHEVAHGSLRVSFSEMNTEEDVDRIIEALPKVIGRLREMSPVWERIVQEDAAKN
jgi:cysteine desulfurase